MGAGSFNIEIEKRAKYYQAFDVTLDDETPVSLVGKTVECKVKESYETTEVLHYLTEANGGILILDDALGKFALVIDADQTNVIPDYGVYDVVIINTSDPTNEIERLLEGKVTYTEGAT